MRLKLGLSIRTLETSSAPTGSLACVPEYSREKRLVQLASALFFVRLAFILAAPLFSHDFWLIFVQDDLLYYLKVAQSIAHGHGSTFNGVVSTNGYQPLWLLVLTGLSFFTEKSGSVMIFLSIVNLVASIATFLLSSRLLRLSGARPLLVFALASWITLYSVTLFFYGMEVTLTVPIVLGVLCLLHNMTWLEQGFLRTFVLGLLLSAMVLSRIDTMIFGMLLLIGILASPSVRQRMRPKLIAGVGLGLSPVPLYFLLNHLLFHTWLPISGMAKELKLNYLPSPEPWRVFFHPLAGGLAVLAIGSFLLFFIIRDRLSPITRVLIPATLIFPFLYYFILCCVSDWTLWGWYIYPTRAALCISLLTLLFWQPSLKFLERTSVTVVLLLSVLACLSVLHWTRQQADIYAASEQVRQFAQMHPGVYALGDGAGRVAYMIPDPVIQTEGLMMDREYLGYVARRTPLRETLAHYQVRYYIATAYEPFTGCFEASEPAKGGPGSAKMRATFCEAPLASFLHDGNRTLIYDLQPGK
jgi:hypothetical protein